MLVKPLKIECAPVPVVDLTFWCCSDEISAQYSDWTSQASRGTGILVAYQRVLHYKVSQQGSFESNKFGT